MDVTTLPEWAALESCLVAALDEGDLATDAADWSVPAVLMDGDRVSMSTGLSFEAGSPDEFDPDRHLLLHQALHRLSPPGGEVRARGQALIGATVAAGVPVYCLRVCLRRDGGSWHVVRRYVQTQAERVAFVASRAAAVDELVRALTTVPGGPWTKVYARWESHAAPGAGFAGYWSDDTQEVAGRVPEPGPALARAYAALEQEYAALGVLLGALRVSVTDGPDGRVVNVRDVY
ncbi:hypothetical protein [Kineosporia sp. A_224]|jgi:hypothetical protein|uniref:hypothetical protein n=1 Tax=Kineosporia sp. A_224 TaxID=1962180 RepID=UPI000B4B7224|nr:hypothetical protein [Kineosporia sp. A_224]